MTMMRTLGRLIALAPLLVAVACGSSGPTAPTAGSPATAVEVGVAAGAEAIAGVGATLQLWAQTKNKDGGTTDVTSIATWQTSNPAMATVSNGGLMHAAQPGSVTISATFGKLTGTVAVNILACVATVPPRLLFTANGGFGTIPVTLSQSDCRWTVASSDTSWLYVYPSSQASGSANVSYQVSPNPAATARKGAITITVPDGRGATVSIEQDKPSCSFVVTPPARSVPAAGGSFTFDVATTPATCDWELNAYEGGNLRVTGPRSGRGNATIAYTVLPNQVPYTQFYTIEIRPALNDAPPARHQITQAPR